mmetsp:Transcript_25554/g.54981  ORF Transcript_25554/g.54981 Transcript_25554/m.54981 type:complete len:92 (+) Transcript_25554:1361-1636(+)
MPWWMIGGLGLIFHRAWQRYGTVIRNNIGWEIAAELIGDLSMVAEVVEGGRGEDEEQEGGKDEEQEEDEDEDQCEVIVGKTTLQIIIHGIN